MLRLLQNPNRDGAVTATGSSCSSGAFHQFPWGAVAVSSLSLSVKISFPIPPFFFVKEVGRFFPLVAALPFPLVAGVFAPMVAEDLAT